MTEPERVVQSQVEAYNRHDLEAFVETYDPGVRVWRFPEGTLLLEGHAQLRAAYALRFAPGSRVRAVVTQRIVQGRIVIDAETIHGLLPDRPLTATAIYEVADGRIRQAWFVRDWPEQQVADALARTVAAAEVEPPRRQACSAGEAPLQ